MAKSTRKWREDPPALSPEMERSVRRRRIVFAFLSALLALVAVVAVMMFVVRTVPQPHFVPLWVADYQSAALPPRLAASQDRDAFRDGHYFTSPVPDADPEAQTLLEQVAALRAAPRTEPVVVYLSAYASPSGDGTLTVLPANDDLLQARNGVLFREVLEALQSCPARHKLLILDLNMPTVDPRLGLLVRDVPALVQGELAAVPDGARLVLCSCSPGQTPLVSDDQRRSVFSYYVETALRGEAAGFNQGGSRNGQISACDLGEFVRARVERWAWRNRRVHQTPMLIGNNDDFALLAMERRQVKPALPIPEAEKYPKWLREAWEVRERWRTDESYRLSPQLFRQLETTLLTAEQVWRQGADAERIQESLKARLVRLEQRLKKARVPALAKAPVLALDAKVAAPTEKLLHDIEQEMSAVRVKPSTAPKEPLKLSADLLELLEKTPASETVQAAYEAAANAPQLHPERLRWLNLVIQNRQTEPQTVESLFLERLGDLADQTPLEQWPAETVRQALEVLRLGERAAAQPQVFPWIREGLEEAAQKRFEGELFLLGGNGYAPPGEARRRLQEAAERYEAAQRRGDTVREIQRLLDEAFALLTAYVPYLERVPEQEAAWLDAVDSCVRLTDLLAAAPADLSGAAQPMTQLIDDLTRLQRPFSADALADLQLRLRRTNAPPTALHEANALLATPFLSPDDREGVWKAARTLSRRLHEETVRQDQADVKQTPQPLDTVSNDATTRILEVKEGQRALQRARISLALLRLGGLPRDDQQVLEDQFTRIATVIAGESGRASLESLGTALRRTWTQRVPELLQPGQDLTRRDRLSRVYLPFDPAVIVEDTAPLPQTEVRIQRQKELLTWRLDRTRYESRQLAALGLLTDRGARFFTRAAASYQTLAGVVPREPACAINSEPALVRLTPAATAAKATLQFRGLTATAGEKTLPVHLLLPNTNWLRVTPELPGAADLEESTWLNLPVSETASLPLSFVLKPNATETPPQGMFVETPCGQRAAFYRLPISLDAVSDRLEILLSANPREPLEPLSELRLRPLKTRQPYYLYVRNPSAKPRKVLVQLANVPGGEAKVELAPNETKQVRFTAAPAPAQPTAPPMGTAPAPEGVFTELSERLQVRLLDLDGGNRVIDERAFPVRVASASDYTKVFAIQFTPPSERDQSLGSGQNRLTVTLQATPAFNGPPSPVELILPPSRIPGLLGVKSGTLKGELPARGEVSLFAENMQFANDASEEGAVYLSVDGDPRAYIFRTTFARGGSPTTPREDAAPALRLIAGRFAATGATPSVTLEVDHPPNGATVELSLGRYQEGEFQPDAVYKRPTAKRQRLALAPAGTDGALLFEASTGDWVIQPETDKVSGARVLRGRLLDKEGAPLRTVYETLTLDDAPPKGIHFVEPPRLAKKDAPLTLKAASGASVSGVSEVFFFLGKDVQNKPPQGAALIPGRALDDAKTTWTATFPLRGEKSGPTEFSVQFINRAGQSSFGSATIELIDQEPSKVLPGRIEGVVLEGTTPVPGLTVSLRDEKNVEKTTTKTNDNGEYTFDKLTPGKYLLYTSRPANKRQGSAITNVVAEQTTKVPPIKLYKP